MYVVKNDAERIPVAVEYCKDQVEKLSQALSAYDYDEDVNGNLVYCPGFYSDEKRELENEKLKWETMLRILTDTTPLRLYDYY